MVPFTERSVLAKNMIAGLTAHVSELSGRGITQEVIEQIVHYISISASRQAG